MKRVLSVVLAMLLLSLESCWEISPAYAADVQLGKGGTYRTLAAKTAWSSANQTWVISPINQNESACIFVTNFNPSSSHTFTLAVKQTSDPYVADYSNNTAEWIPAVVNGAVSPLAAASSVQVSASLSGAAQFAVIVSGASSASGSPDTLNIFLTQGAPCTAANTWTLNSQPAAGSQAIATISAIAGVRHVAQCFAACVASANSTGNATPVDFEIRDSATCGGGAILWDAILATPAAAGQSACQSICGPQLAIGTAGTAMTVCASGALTNVYERVSASGYDTQ